MPFVYKGLSSVHILRQPPEGGEGVSQMLTIADEGREGGCENPKNWVTQYVDSP